MKSSVWSKKYSKFQTLLIGHRHSASITQASLAEKLNKPQSFVSKYESGERRLDLIEFLEVANALQINPSEFITELEKDFSI